MTTTPIPWKPRGSALGSYVACSNRAALDRAFYEHLLDLTEDELKAILAARESSPYADLGTCIHFTLQDGLRCKWGKGTRDDHIPDAEQWANAAGLFNKDIERTKAQVFRSATLAGGHLQHKKWVAETEVITPFISGHIDFLSEDGEELVDLKTTAKPPLAGKAKPAHLVQVLIYCAALEYLTGKLPKRVTILYVDSINAAWAYPVHFDLTFEPLVAYMHSLRNFALFLMGPHLYDSAVPSIGAACDDWCPYTGICRDIILSASSAGAATTPKPIKMKGPLS